MVRNSIMTRPMPPKRLLSCSALSVGAQDTIRKHVPSLFRETTNGEPWAFVLHTLHKDGNVSCVTTEGLDLAGWVPQCIGQELRRSTEAMVVDERCRFQMTGDVVHRDNQSLRSTNCEPSTPLDDVTIQPEIHHAQDTHDDNSSGGEAKIPPTQKALGFQISDQDKVTAFLMNRLDRIKEATNKKIAKSWIKGICPHKQKKFPYKKNSQPSNTVPPWWPDTSVCVFNEPDHIVKSARLPLLVYLLRLRPTPERLDEWNGGETARIGRDVHVTRGWTEFLRSVTNEELDLKDSKDKPGELEYRKQMFRQIMEVAEYEEAYVRDEQDIYYSYIDDGRKAKHGGGRTKGSPAYRVQKTRRQLRETRNRQARVNYALPPTSPTSSAEGDTAAPSPSVDAQPHGEVDAKFVVDTPDRNNSRATTVACSPIDQSTSPEPATACEPNPFWMSRSMDVSSGMSFVPGIDMNNVHPIIYPQASACSSASTSFAMTQSDFHEQAFITAQASTGESNFSGQHSFNFTQHEGTFRPELQVHPVRSVPDPNFHPTPHMAFAVIPQHAPSYSALVAPAHYQHAWNHSDLPSHASAQYDMALPTSTAPSNLTVNSESRPHHAHIQYRENSLGPPNASQHPQY